MIMATVRHQLTRDDAQLVGRLISRDSGTPLEEIERALADQGIDAVLDDPRLPAALLREGQGTWAAAHVFSCGLKPDLYKAEEASGFEGGRNDRRHP